MSRESRDLYATKFCYSRRCAQTSHLSGVSLDLLSSLNYFEWKKDSLERMKCRNNGLEIFHRIGRSPLHTVLLAAARSRLSGETIPHSSSVNDSERLINNKNVNAVFRVTVFPSAVENSNLFRLHQTVIHIIQLVRVFVRYKQASEIICIANALRWRWQGGSSTSRDVLCLFNKLHICRFI